MSAHLLVVDDDRAIRESLVRALGFEGYRVTTAADGARALTAMSDDPPDLVLLDVMMPSVDGLTVCKVLRSEGNHVPVLVLTARTDTSDKVAGLDAGADDYLPKPFELDELLARIRALLRRAQLHTESVSAEAPLSVGDLVVDPAARRVWRAGTEIELSRTEFSLLELLVRNAGIVLDHTTIYDRIWGYDFGPESKNLAVYIRYLRRKIDDDHDVKLIQTVRGFGYCVRAS